MKKVFRYLLITLFTAVICLCGYKLLGISERYIQEANTKKQLMVYRPDAASPDDEAERTAVNQKILALQNEVNNCILGWLTIPETGIDYPFVLPADNSYYLKRDLYGNYAEAGSLFMDYRCNEDFIDFNTIIYGHNMKNSSMFGDLRLFADEGFFDANRYGTIFLKDRTLSLKFFAYMVVRSTDRIIYEPSGDRSEFFGYVKANARNYREPDMNRRIVTLSTCSYEFNDARIVLIAVISNRKGGAL